MISRQLGQIANAGAMLFLLRITRRVYNGFSIRIWPVLVCKARLLPLIGKNCGRNLRRGSIHGDNSISERLPCLLETVSLSDVMPKPLSQNFDRAFEHILVQYGDLKHLWRILISGKSWNSGMLRMPNKSPVWCFTAVNLFRCTLLDIRRLFRTFIEVSSVSWCTRITSRPCGV